MSETLLHSPVDLLRAVDRADPASLADVLTTYADIDVSVIEFADDHIQIYAGGLGIELEFPFSVGELWEAADQLAAWEAR